MITHRRRPLSIMWLSVVVIAFMAMPAKGQNEIPVTTSSDEALAHFEEGRNHLENLRRHEARQALDKAIEADGSFATAHLHRAWAASSNDEFYKHLRHAVKQSDRVTKGERLTIMAAKAGADNDPVKAIELWTQLAEMYPEDKRVHHRLAREYNGQEMDAKATAHYERAISIDSEWAPPYNTLGYLYREAGDYGKAEETFQKYVSLLPDEPNPYDSLADLYTKMGRYEEAIANYTRAVEIGAFPMSQRKIGDNYVFMGQFEKGREAYGRAIELETTDGGKLTDLSRISFSYLLEGKTEAAIKASEKVLKAARKSGLPDWEAAIHAGVRSEAFLLVGDFQKAQQSIEECRRLVANSDLDASVKEGFERWAVLREGVIAAKKGDTERAEARVDQHYALIDADDDINQVEAHHALVGIVKLEGGDYAAAVKHLKKADQQDPYVLYHLALAQNKAGNLGEATELMAKVSGWNENGLGYATVKMRADNELNKMRAGLE